MTPKDHVAVGQSFELLHDPGTLFTITEVKRTWNKVDGELWFITLLCVVSDLAWFRPGRISTQTSHDGTLRATGYRRIG